jgi:hypothetical protein
MISIEGVRAEFLLSGCLRYDLAPIPLTLEAQIRITPATAPLMQDGGLIRVNEIPFRIIKCEPLRNVGGGPQGDSPLSAVTITAFPDAVVGVARRRRSAVIAQGESFASIYRSCGATVGIDGDFPVSRFACFKGSVPTFNLAQILQEESAVMMWASGRVKIMRLRDVMAQAPVIGLSVTASEDVASSFLENDEIPTYISTGPDGKFILGARRFESQAVKYSPHKGERELGYMGRVLVRRRVLTSLPNLSLQAGAVVESRNGPMVVMTAAHYMQNNTDGAGASQYSRFWLGSIS